jgi:heme/copper-type cytochrome/quinol oxidase subunit 3
MSFEMVTDSEEFYFEPRPQREPLVPSAILGMLIFVVSEATFFGALLSAFMVIKAGSPNWAPPPGVTLPVKVTAFNTAVLFTSGVLLLLAGRVLSQEKDWQRAKTLTGWAALLGAFFVGFQGIEWVRLLYYGMTMTSGVFGACFYLLVGCHALHAVAAIIAMIGQFRRFEPERLAPTSFYSMSIFWFFVVGVWPVLYIVVYLS